MTAITRIPSITISDVPPAGPLEGDLWWSTVVGQQYVYYDDGTTIQWVIANYGAGKPGTNGLPGIPGPPGNTTVVLDLVALRALSPPLTDYQAGATTLYCEIPSDGGSGNWVFMPGDQSFYVSADPQGGIWVAPDVNSDGTGGAWMRTYDGPADLAWFRTRGDGVTDDLDAINAAFLTAFKLGLKLTGGGRLYAVDGALIFRDEQWLQDAKFIQLTPNGSSSRRSLTAEHIKKGVTLIRVSLDRNGTPDDITVLGSAAGIYFSGEVNTQTADFYFEDVEVFGGGPGTGCIVTDAATASFVRPHIHDMFWHAALDPGSGGEKVVAISTARVRKVYYDDPQIHRLMGWYDAPNPLWPEVAGYQNALWLRGYQTDGIGATDTDSASVWGGRISNLMEGYDGSGNQLSSNVWFYGTTFEDCGVGHKTSASRNSGMVGCRFVRTERWATVLGANIYNHNSVRNFRYEDVVAIDTGANHAAPQPIAFTALNTPAYYPHKGVEYNNCSAIGNCATVRGTIAGTLLTVTELIDGELADGQWISGTNVPAGPGATVEGFCTGNLLKVTNTLTGAVAPRQLLTGGGIRKYTQLAEVGSTHPNWIINKHTDAPQNTFTLVGAPEVYIVGRGKRAAVIASIHGNNNLTISHLRYGTVEVGMVIYGPNIKEGLKISAPNGSPTEWIIDVNPHPDVLNTAMLLSLDVVPNSVSAAIVGDITGNNLHVDSVLSGTVAIGQMVYVRDAPTDLRIVSGSGSDWILSGAWAGTHSNIEITLTAFTATYTVSQSLTVPSTIMTMTSNMFAGWRLDANDAESATLNDAVVDGANTVDFYSATDPMQGVPHRMSKWDPYGRYQIRGGLRIDGRTEPDLRFASFDLDVNDKFDALKLRHDDNSGSSLLKFQNFEIGGADQGIGVLWEYGINNNYKGTAGSISVLSTENWSAPANQSTKMVATVAQDGSVTAAFIATALDFLIKQTLSFNFGAQIDGATTDTLKLIAPAGIAIGTGSTGPITTKTPPAGNNSTQVATTAFVQGALATTLSAFTREIPVAATAIPAGEALTLSLNDPRIHAVDMVIVQHRLGGTLGAYNCAGTAGDGTAEITVRNVSSTALTEDLTLKLIIIHDPVT